MGVIVRSKFNHENHFGHFWSSARRDRKFLTFGKISTEYKDKKWFVFFLFLNGADTIPETRGHNLVLLVLLQRTHERRLLGVGLEPSVTKLGGGINELEIDLLQGSLLGVSEQRLPEGEHPLLGTNAAALDHEETLLHFTVVREATHGVDGLVGKIVVGAGVVLHQLNENKV